VRPETDFPERFAQVRRVYLMQEGASAAPGDGAPALQSVAVEGVRRQGTGLLLKLAGIESPEAARALSGMAVAVPWEERVPLEAGAFYVGEIVGLRVRTETGEALGRVAEVIRTGAHDLYRVEGAEGEILLPATRDVVRAVDVDKGEMVVTVPPGLR
jgi:16S rRNA processing protein RimM